jgi:O-antigen/teichoic acid export membrane protein
MPDLRALDPEQFRRVSKEGAWIVFGQVAAVLGSLAGVRLLTELLDPAAYGELALGLTVATLVNQTVLGPVANGVTRFYAPAQEQGDLGGYLTAARRLMFRATMIIVVIAALMLTGLLAAGRAQWIGIAAAALVFATLTGFNGILSGIQNAARQRSVVASHQGIEPWARFLVAAGLLLWLGETSTVAMVGYAIAVVLILCSQYAFFRKTIAENAGTPSGERNWQQQIWRYSWPFCAWGIFSWAQQASDRWALGFFATTQDVGLYAALFQLGYYPISMATAMATQFLGPIFYQRAGDASDNRRNKSVSKLSLRLAGMTLALTGTVFLIALLFHAQIFRILVASQYASVSYLLPWMLLAGGIFATGQTIALDLMSRMKTPIMARAKIVTSSLGVVFNFAGAYYFGVKGIVAATVIFSVLYSIWLAAILAKATPEPGIDQ